MVDFPGHAPYGLFNPLFTLSNFQPSTINGKTDASSDIRRIGGYEVNTTGKAAVSAEYDAIHRQVAEMTTAELSAAIKTKNLNISTEDFIAFLKSSGQTTIDGFGDEPTDGTAQDPENPYAATFSHSAATHFAFTALPDLASIDSGLGFIPGDVFTSGSKQALLNHQRHGVEKLMGELQLEREIQKDFGPDAKIAFDKRAGNYIVLQPGDMGYNQVDSGEKALANTYDFFRKGFADIRDFADIFEKYGHTV